MSAGVSVGVSQFSVADGSAGEEIVVRQHAVDASVVGRLVISLAVARDLCRQLADTISQIDEAQASFRALKAGAK